MRKFLAIVAVLALLLAMSVPAFASGNVKSPSGDDAKDDASKSPQTGFDATAWTAAMGGLLLVAGVCFVCAKKVTE